MSKNLFLLFTAFIFSLRVQAATITWIGTSGSNWDDPANWIPAMVPGLTDDVVFNTSVSVEMDIIPARNPQAHTIHSLLITSNAAVILTRTQPGGGTRIFRLASTDAITAGLIINNGSSLTIDAVNNTGTLYFSLDLTGAAGVTGNVSGDLFFSGTGAGNGRAFLNLYEDADHFADLHVTNTGRITYLTNSGNTNSSETGTYLSMEAGSTYEINKNGGSLPQGNWDDNSTILISGATTAAGGITFTQERYGNLQWNSPDMRAVVQLIATFSSVTAISLNDFVVTNTNGRELRLKTGAGSSAPPFDYTVRGKLDISSDGILVITGNNVSNAGAGASLHVMGDINIEGIFKSDGAAGTINELELNGTSNQTIANNGTFSGAQFSFIINNEAGATLSTDLILPGTNASALSLVTGKIITNTNAVLKLQDGAGYTGGSSASFVEGPMAKIGADPLFTFPVGKGGIYAPVSFNTTGLIATDEFTAEYMRVNPQNFRGTNYEAPFDHISFVEYWTLNKTVNNLTAPVNVSLSITPYSFAHVMNSTYITHYNELDGQWKNSGTLARTEGPPDPPKVTGTIQSIALSGLGIFTLATTDPIITNPLPVTLIAFTVNKSGEYSADIKWQVAGDVKGIARFEVQRSENGKDFNRLNTVYSSSSKSAYSFSDKLMPVKTWYRLKIIHKSGEILYSKTVFLINYQMSFLITIAPNPSQGKSVLLLNAETTSKIEILIHDISGRRVSRLQTKLFTGGNQIDLPTDKLQAGIFTITVLKDGYKNTIRFVKL